MMDYVRRYNKRYRVNPLRQWWHGSKTIAQEWGLKPCPKCHGNDRIKALREAPGFVMVQCERCEEAYIA